jgi:hypothetical protein
MLACGRFDQEIVENFTLERAFYGVGLGVGLTEAEAGSPAVESLLPELASNPTSLDPTRSDSSIGETSITSLFFFYLKLGAACRRCG